MKISKLFHWLYATLMFLPLLVAPIFGIYSHRHTLDSYSVTTPSNQIVDYNQQYKDEFYNGFTYSGFNGTQVTSTQEHFYQFTISESATGLLQLYHYFPTGTFDVINGHKYYVSAQVYTTNTFEYLLRVYPVLTNNTYIISVPNTYQKVSFIDTATSNNYPKEFGIVSRGGTSLNADDIVIVQNIQITDLTKMFGVGNEPTLTQFNQWYTDDYYSYTLSKKELLQVGTTTYDNTDIGSQFIYTIYGTLDKYFNMSNLLPFNGLSEWLQLNIFNGNFSLGFYIFYNLFLYWFLISLLWLIFDVLMYVPNLAHRWLDRSSLQ